MLTRIYNLLGDIDAALRRRAINEAFRAAFASEDGRIALAEILRMARVHQAATHPPRDARQDAYREGQRALALTILQKAGFGPGRLPEALVADQLEEMQHVRQSVRSEQPDPELSLTE